MKIRAVNPSRRLLHHETKTLRGPGGLELIEDLKARNVRLPVLVLSMHAASQYAERVLQAGAKGYIAKEASPPAVLKAIRKVLAG